MKASDTILTATQNLGRRKVRTILTSIGVFVGILTIVTMVSLGIGIQKQITDTIKQLGLETVYVSPKVDRQPTGAYNPFARQKPDKPLNAAAVKHLQDISGVISVEVMIDLPAAPEMALTIDGKTFPIALRELDARDRVFTSREDLLSGQKV